MPNSHAFRDRINKTLKQYSKITLYVLLVGLILCLFYK